MKKKIAKYKKFLLLILIFFFLLIVFSDSLRFSQLGMTITRINMTHHLEKKYHKKFEIEEVRKEHIKGGIVNVTYYKKAKAYPKDNPNQLFSIDNLMGSYCDDYYIYLIEEKYSTQIKNIIDSIYPNESVYIEFENWACNRSDSRETNLEKLVDRTGLTIGIKPQNSITAKVTNLDELKLKFEQARKRINLDIRKMEVKIETADSKWQYVYCYDKYNQCMY